MRTKAFTIFKTLIKLMSETHRWFERRLKQRQRNKVIKYNAKKELRNHICIFWILDSTNLDKFKLVTAVECSNRNNGEKSVSMMTSSNGTFSPWLALCAGNSPVTGEFPSQRPVTRSLKVFFDLRLNIRFSKQSICRWFEKPSRSL